MRRIAAYGAVLFLFASSSLAASLEEYAGRYALTDGSVLNVSVRDGALVAKPIFWTSLQTLKADGVDRFVVADRPDRRASFERDAKGRIVAVRMSGIGDDARLSRLSAKASAVELLFAGNAEEAAKRVSSETTAVDFAEKLVSRFPSRNAIALRYLAAIEKRWPENVRLQRVFGDALVAAGRRGEARAHYERSRTDAQSVVALRMLASAEPGEAGWTVPFPFADLFAQPTPEERDSVLSMWKARDLRAREVRIVDQHPVAVPGGTATLLILSHRIYGAKHYTAVITPAEARPGCCPVIVDAKGVSWNFFPRDLSKLPDSVAMMEDATRFVFVIPSFRGEEVLDGAKRYVSEGDRTDVWDGATDDAIGALNAALKVVPAADASRVCTFGRSRGGTVALLMAIRDPRVDCVVAWSAPVDHFRLMAHGGWTKQEEIAEGLREKSPGNGIGGQFIETFLRGAIEREQSLAETRLHLIASSPLYFAERLPLVQLHNGVEDTMVPIANGEALKAAARNVEAFFYPGFGHDADPPSVYKHARRFLNDAAAK